MADEQDKSPPAPRLDLMLRLIGVIILLIFIAVLPVIALTDLVRPDVQLMMVQQHPGPFVALPGAGVFAWLVVAIFQITSGKIELKIGGPFDIELTGAAGPILMWIIAYFVIAFSMYLLW